MPNDFFNGMMGNNLGGPAAWVGFGLGWILMLIFWALIIWAIVSLIRYAFWKEHFGSHPYDRRYHSGFEDRYQNQREREKPRDSYSGSDSSFNILRERYARGEIDREEYEEKKKDLMREM